MRRIAASILILAGFGSLAGCAPSLKWAAYLGNTGAVRNHLAKGADVSKKNEALSWAANMGRTEIARLLIDDGAEVDWGNGSPLNWAAGSGRAGTVNLLIERGAKVRSDTLTNAALGRNADVVKLLVGLSSDADIDTAIAELRSFNDRESTAGLHLIERFRPRPSQGISTDGRSQQPVQPLHPPKDPLDQDAESIAPNKGI